jgi:hypothetical protein
MLKIRQEQIYKMMDDDESLVTWYLNVFMPEHLPTYYYSSIHEESRREMVLQGKKYAAMFGLVTFPSIVHFVTMMFNVGPNFFIFPGFREALTARAASESEVIDRMYAVSFEDAQRAMQGADDRYWWPETIPKGNNK